MKLDEGDLEQTFYQPTKKYVDQSIGFVLLVLVVVLVFSIFLSGIIRVQTATNPQSNDSAYPMNQYERTVIQHDAEIGGADDRAKFDIDPAQ